MKLGEGFLREGCLFVCICVCVCVCVCVCGWVWVCVCLGGGSPGHAGDHSLVRGAVPDDPVGTQGKGSVLVRRKQWEHKAKAVF